MDTLQWIALSAGGLVLLGWLVSKVRTDTKLPPKPEDGLGVREPRNPLPLVGVGADAKDPGDDEERL